MILIDADSLTASRPDKPLFTNLSMTINDGDRWGIVGINGCGKSTFLRMLAGDIQPESGVVRRSKTLRMAVLEQDPKLAPGPVREAVLHDLPDADSWEAEEFLDRLGMGGMLDADTTTLSGGQAKRVALARALVSQPDLLILDEPTNHLDLDAIAWLEARLARYRGGLIMVSHDRHVLDRVLTRVLEIDRGTGYVHDGGYQGFLDGRASREDRAASEESTRQILAKRELAWLRRGAPARTAKSKARIESATKLINDRPQAAARSGAFEIGAATGRSGEGQGPTASAAQGSYRNAVDTRLAPRLGNKVVDLHGIGHRFPAIGSAPDSGEFGPWLFKGLEILLDPGARYGIVGANGTGKSTLLDIISGRLVPAEGTIDTGPTVRVGYYDQRGRTLDPTMRVRDAVAGKNGVAGSPEDKRLMEQFWFVDDAQFSPVGLLSGGEKRRLQLLMVLAERPNVLLLDEPTNDLDLDTLRALEDFLEDWPGTVVVVSHDRAFMDRTVEEVLAIEGGKATLVAGGYAGWRARREERLVAEKGSGKGAGKAPSVAPSVATGSVAKSLNAPKASSAPTGPKQSTAPTAPTAPVAKLAEKPAAPKRSASTLRQLIKDAEREVNRLTKARDKLTAELEAAGNDFTKITALGTQLATIQAELDPIEERWLELAAEQES
jgi:ABC transport system ATP-binding/permease protein